MGMIIMRYNAELLLKYIKQMQLLLYNVQDFNIKYPTQNDKIIKRKKLKIC